MGIADVRPDFPILARSVNGVPLVYLDSAATSQKPHSVIQAEARFYEEHNAAAHRGSHQLAQEATDAYEGARETIASFIGAQPSSLVFTRSATDSINLVANAFLNASAYAQQGIHADPRFVLTRGDSVVVTELEHHANLVPWQELCKKTGASLRWVPVDVDGRLEVDRLTSIIDSTTKVVAWTHVSNVLGHIVDPEPIRAAAKTVGAITVLDACQSIPHIPVTVEDLDVDFIAWSAHKMLGPTGLGFLWGRPELLDAMPVVSTGGSMITHVTMEESGYLPAPAKFEPGVPPMAQAVGAAAAVDYLSKLGMSGVHQHVSNLAALAAARLSEVRGVTVLGGVDFDRVSAVSFNIDGLHPHDVGQVLDSRGVAVRVGHHCAWPLMRAMHVNATVRASFSVYNDTDDVEALVEAVEYCRDFFAARLKQVNA